MLHSHRSVGSLSTPGQSVRKQHSENFGGSTRHRGTGSVSSLPRPTNEFGWQIALQGVTLDARGTIAEEEAPVIIQDGSDTPNLTLRDGASDATLTAPSSPPALHSSPLNDISRSYSVISSLSSSSTKRELAEKYADKDIGWQLALQAQDIPHILPSQEERGLDRRDSSPYSGVDVTSRESPRLNQDPNADQNTFQQLNLDEAAKIYSGFVTGETSVQPGEHDEPTRTPQVARTPSYLANNPFHAMIQAAEAARKPLLIDLEEEEPAVPDKAVPKAEPEPAQGSVSPELRQPEDNNTEDNQLSCDLCPKQQVPVNRISQIPSCLHLVCNNCLLQHIQRQLFDSYFPIKCPVCLLLEEHSDDSPPHGSTNQGVVTLEIAHSFKALAPSTFDIFESFQISSQSSQVFCPKCQETMLVDRSQYLQESIITCPRDRCGHKWCKSCFKEMDSAEKHSTHKCKPDKAVGVRACPECGYQGRRVAGDNFIPCRGVGCRVHFCFKCGDTIVDRSTKPQNTTSRIEAHYDKCTRYSKEDKCTIQ